jgi:hypothetical protein
MAAARLGRAQFNPALSSGTTAVCRGPKGKISGEGTLAQCLTSAGGHYRAVFDGMARAGEVLEWSVQRVGGAELVWLFICIGAPTEDTGPTSPNVLLKQAKKGARVRYVRGVQRDDEVDLDLPVGGTLSCRINCVDGTVAARAGDGQWQQVFKDITAEECARGLYTGVFLDNDAEARLLSFGRVDAATPSDSKMTEVRTCVLARSHMRGTAG